MTHNFDLGERSITFRQSALQMLTDLTKDCWSECFWLYRSLFRLLLLRGGGPCYGGEGGRWPGPRPPVGPAPLPAWGPAAHGRGGGAPPVGGRAWGGRVALAGACVGYLPCPGLAPGPSGWAHATPTWGQVRGGGGGGA